jgi:hypothetical protein
VTAPITAARTTLGDGRASTTKPTRTAPAAAADNRGSARSRRRPASTAPVKIARFEPDKPAKLAKFRDKEGITFPLLSDADKDVLNAWGTFGEKQMYGKTVTGVIRSTFVVDPEGKIEVAQYNVRATGHVAKLRKDLSDTFDISRPSNRCLPLHSCTLTLQPAVGRLEHHLRVLTGAGHHLPKPGC